VAGASFGRSATARKNSSQPAKAFHCCWGYGIRSSLQRFLNEQWLDIYIFMNFSK